MKFSFFGKYKWNVNENSADDIVKYENKYLISFSQNIFPFIFTHTHTHTHRYNNGAKIFTLFALFSFHQFFILFFFKNSWTRCHFLRDAMKMAKNSYTKKPREGERERESLRCACLASIGLDRIFLASKISITTFFNFQRPQFIFKICTKNIFFLFQFEFAF